MFQSLLFQLDTLISWPRLLGLEFRQLVLTLQKLVHAEVNAAVLLKQSGDVRQTWALLVSVRFRPE